MMATIRMIAPKGSTTPVKKGSPIETGVQAVGAPGAPGTPLGREDVLRGKTATGGGSNPRVGTLRRACSSESHNSGLKKDQSSNRAAGTSSIKQTPSNGRTSSLGLQLWNPWLKRSPAVEQKDIVSGRLCLKHQIAVVMPLLPLFRSVLDPRVSQIPVARKSDLAPPLSSFV